MESTVLGVILDSSIIIEAERKHQTIEQFLIGIRQRFGEIDIAISAVTVAELVYGVERANTAEVRRHRRAFIDELKRHVPVYAVTEEAGELAGTISGTQAAKGIIIPMDDLLIGASALYQGYAVATQNERHFRKLPGLVLMTF